jgi:rhomboid protease GluP
MDDEQARAAADFAGRDETFCRYLAKQLIAKQGFVEGAPQAAADIAAQSDYVLTYHDGYSPIIIGLIDRDAHPGKGFTLSVARVRQIAKDCRALAGRVGMTKMPVGIQLMEVADATPDQLERLAAIKPSSFFSKLMISAWTIDPQRAAIWSTADYRSRGRRKFIQGLLDNPREAVVAPQPIVVAPRTFPWLTAAMIAVLLAIFGAEIAFGVGEVEAAKQPTIETLLAFGGLMGRLVTHGGEWYRLFMAPLLHGGFQHILLNAIALGLAGFALEPLIGRAWFATTFVVGAICGALASLAFNPDTIVSVGASGAVMALFACMLVLAQHFPKGAARTQLQMNAIYVLLPSLLPLASVLKGAKVDYAAHFGGAIGGALVGLLLLRLWRRDEQRPRLRAAALAIALAGLAVFVAAGALAQRNFAVYDITAALVPSGAIPTSDDAARRRSADLVARYPRDPRAQFMHAMTLLRTNDTAGAERALRAGLAEEAVWRRALVSGDISERLHAVLALVLSESGRTDEAREVAKPACAPGSPAPLRAALDKQKLCAD